ncbi:LysR family transcriptional regulator [Mammaliicoccus vitulinus]|uniref:LysR family transcriptional regulator n=2 Tax=Mammaliicoccus vitulinus TaxID=71237 RepID=A0A2T4PWV0_9STAP|nr:LysR family transcriptional regulator [Mammaliicoccus vitulinus]PNZ40069.1 LysR family transcriptional regulator [Mammaliicoccus vitulinus]PTI30965.1 LysR family transcriptional regulator [Mammaliicoccus vitulinus]QRO86096.1 LysR family transcriptional regulator [Mammaliicoccus vitulinus]RIN25514.1 LysR family transcriptional regulator [Mammaliicoccus vitulinus]
MNLNDLEIFKTVYESDSINQAASKLKYAQSNISQRINHIEKYLEVKLFIRSNNGIEPNEEGKEFYNYCLRVLNETEFIKTKIKNNKQTLLCSELLFSYLTQQNKFFTDSDIDIATTTEINKKLQNKIYNKVISFNKIPNYVLEKTETLNLAFFNNDKDNHLIPLLINRDEQCPLRQLSLKVKTEHQNILEIDSLEAIISLVELGKGTALLPIYLENNREIERDSLIQYSLDYYYHKISK